MRVPDEELYEIALKEFKLLENLKGHPNVPAPIDIFYNKFTETIYMLMEHAGTGSDLKSLLAKDP